MAEIPWSEDQTVKRVPNNTQRRGTRRAWRMGSINRGDGGTHMYIDHGGVAEEAEEGPWRRDGLTPKQALRVMERVMHTFKEKAEDEAKKPAVRVHKEELEAKKCRSSLLMHNAYK